MVSAVCYLFVSSSGIRHDNLGIHACRIIWRHSKTMYFVSLCNYHLNIMLFKLKLFVINIMLEFMNFRRFPTFINRWILELTIVQSQSVLQNTEGWNSRALEKIVAYSCELTCFRNHNALQNMFIKMRQADRLLNWQESIIKKRT
jgi:hypothetical protein